MFITEKEKSDLFNRQREHDARIGDTLGLIKQHMQACCIENKARRVADDEARARSVAIRKEFRGYLVAILVALIGMAAAMRGNLL